MKIFFVAIKNRVNFCIIGSRDHPSNPFFSKFQSKTGISLSIFQVQETIGALMDVRS